MFPHEKSQRVADGGPHEATLSGKFWEVCEPLRFTQGVSTIAGAYRRSAEVIPSKLIADTSTRAVTVQTPHLFIDLRIASTRPSFSHARALDGLTNAELAELINSTHCFGGITQSEPAPTNSGHTCMCTRWHLVDWQPFPRLSPNRWSVEERWDQGGWVEWSARRDSAGQAAYIEYWRTLRGSRDGPFVALRQLPVDDEPPAMLLIAGQSFAYISGRGEHPSHPRLPHVPNLPCLPAPCLPHKVKPVLCIAISPSSSGSTRHRPAVRRTWQAWTPRRSRARRASRRCRARRRRP